MNQFSFKWYKKYIKVLQNIISNIQTSLKNKEHQSKFAYNTFLMIVLLNHPNLIKIFEFLF